MKILQMVSSLNGGGIEKMLFEYYKYMNREEIHFDFIKVDTEKGILEKELENMGSKIFIIKPIRGNYKEYCSTLTKIIQQEKYDVIHCNGGYRSFQALKIAKTCGIPVRIAHSHTSNIPENIIQKLERKVASFLTKQYATNLFACGVQAAEWMWGRKSIENGKVTIINNAIDTEKFKFSQEKRNQLRKKFQVEDKYVIGHVGRFSYAKNHEFIIEMFQEILKKNNKYILLLVGCGELEGKVTEKINSMNLTESVKLLGIRDDIYDLLNLMDIFILPSKFEGFPVTTIEVQANGLPLILSQAITKEVLINSNVKYLPFDKKLWADTIMKESLSRVDDGMINVLNAGFDIKNESKKLEEIYIKCLTKHFTKRRIK